MTNKNNDIRIGAKKRSDRNMLKKLFISGVVLLTAICGSIYDIQKSETSKNIISQKPVNKEESKSKKSTGKVEKSSENKNKETEIVEESKVKEESSNTSSSSEKNINKPVQENKNNTTQETQSSHQINNSQPQTSQPQNSQPQVPPRQQTEWERLGISQDAYFNTPMFSWEEKAYPSIDNCIKEASFINNKYGFVTNYGTVSGKYVDTVGCWVKIYVDGNKYYLSDFKALGYETMPR